MEKEQKPSPPATKPLPPGAIVIGFVSLFADISTEVMYPLLPDFITKVLGAPVVIVGLIEGVANGVSSIITGLSGWLSDKIGRRKHVAFVGYALTALSKPVIALATGWSVVLGARFADRFGKGIRGAPRDALLAETASEDQRGRAFGFERAMDSAGAVIGPLLAILLVSLLGFGVRTVFILATIPAVIAALLMLCVKEHKSIAHSSTTKVKLTLAGTTRDYKKLLIISGIFGLGNSANLFLILRAENLGLPMGLIILAYTIYNAISASASMPAGSASDKLGRRNVLAAGYLVYAISYIGFALAGSAWMVWPLFALYGLFPALSEGAGKALAVDTSGTAGRATAIGVYSTVIGVTQVAASYIGGLLWDHIDPRATFYLGGALALISVVLLFALLPSRPHIEKSI